MPYDIDLYFNGARGILIPCTCDQCGNTFSRDRKFLSKCVAMKQDKIFCNLKCYHEAKVLKFKISCINCGNECERVKSQMGRYKNYFCGRSCAATYNNTHKTKGTRRSKLEFWLESQLTQLLPDLEILYSDKTTINSELDIYIPSMKIAFELNGIFHYEPIFGVDKLGQIQNNDERKFQACLEKGIELCIIDTSSLKYFKETNCKKYLDIILNIINTKNDD
jgi:hypothetical protein